MKYKISEDNKKSWAIGKPYTINNEILIPLVDSITDKEITVGWKYSNEVNNIVAMPGVKNKLEVTDYYPYEHDNIYDNNGAFMDNRMASWQDAHKCFNIECSHYDKQLPNKCRKYNGQDLHLCNDLKPNGLIME